jgi:hypothetical protein
LAFLCFSFVFRLLIVLYIADLFSGNDLTQKSPEIFNLRPLDNIAPRARPRAPQFNFNASDPAYALTGVSQITARLDEIHRRMLESFDFLPRRQRL